MFSEKASAIARMHQKCVRNASEMHQKCVKMGLVLLGKENVQNASEIRQNWVKNASNMRGTPLGENTFWTIPKIAYFCGDDLRGICGMAHGVAYRTRRKINGQHD